MLVKSIQNVNKIIVHIPGLGCISINLEGYQTRNGTKRGTGARIKKNIEPIIRWRAHLPPFIAPIRGGIGVPVTACRLQIWRSPSLATTIATGTRMRKRQKHPTVATYHRRLSSQHPDPAVFLAVATAGRLVASTRCDGYRRLQIWSRETPSGGEWKVSRQSRGWRGSGRDGNRRARR